MEQIKIGREEWFSLFDEIQSQFAPGELIPHEWLKEKFTMKKLETAEYDKLEDFIHAIQMQQFAYMTLVDALRWQLLEECKIYLRSIRGDGYTILPASDQVRFGYDEFVKTIKLAVKQADMIMNNVLPVPIEQQAKDSDLRARPSMLKQMLKGVKG